MYAPVVLCACPRAPPPAVLVWEPPIYLPQVVEGKELRVARVAAPLGLATQTAYRLARSPR